MSQVRKLVSIGPAKKANVRSDGGLCIPMPVHTPAMPLGQQCWELLGLQTVDKHQKGSYRPLPSYGGIWKELWSGLEAVLRTTFSCNIPVLNKHIMAALSLISILKFVQIHIDLGKKILWEGANSAEWYSPSPGTVRQQAQQTLLASVEEQQDFGRAPEGGASSSSVTLYLYTNAGCLPFLHWRGLAPVSFPIPSRSRGSSSSVIREAGISKGRMLPESKPYWGRPHIHGRLEDNAKWEFFFFPVNHLSFWRVPHDGWLGITSLWSLSLLMFLPSRGEKALWVSPQIRPARAPSHQAAGEDEFRMNPLEEGK